MQNTEMKLILASKSPRRIEMFRSHGFEPVVIPSAYEESIPDGLTPAETVMFLSLQKALSVRAQLDGVQTETNKTADSNDDCLIVSADTIVVNDNIILGKPTDEKDAYSMLRALSGRSHEVLTGVCLLGGGTIRCFYETSVVWLADLPEDELAAYIATDEPYDKAGGYAIQETFSKYVTHVEGDIDNIIGFPFERFLKEAEMQL